MTSESGKHMGSISPLVLGFGRPLGTTGRWKFGKEKQQKEYII